ncbi:30S ribosomal protein S18 [Candidatus Falkowbacteria bacterium]|jgi:small subunit ribosomal protein S18|nr:30S ribosomal protein S18 [Candidatus Falkowbacteria bacterium]MBT7007430.1 30S ribosomal protein S18 [Candidatus Falkowbacteria bacterium]
MIKLGKTIKKCYFCENGIHDIDYKDGPTLQKFTSSYAKIVSRKRTKLCSKHQRKVALSVKRARIMAFLPFVNR